LLAIYTHRRVAVNGAEYEAMGKSKKAEIFGEFERRVGTQGSAGRGSGVSTSWAGASVLKD
jgi:hypothetical protein